MILLIDNYDSFSFNLVQMLGGLKEDNEELMVIRNDELTVNEIMNLNPGYIIISPGPGRPSEAGVCEKLIEAAKGKIPILGVCLGHQAICEAFGGRITYAAELMHGKQSRIKVNNESIIFRGMPNELDAARYHSLAADRKMLPEELEVTAEDAEGEIMAVQHKKYEIYGLQFHPESIMTPLGREMIKNFLDKGRALK